MISRFSLFIVSIFGLTGIGLGAFGAHALHDTLSQRGSVDTWHTAVLYQLVHTVALLAVLIGTPSIPESLARCFHWATRCWIVGVVLFSGSLYLLALGGPRWLGPITPLGGLAFILGWGSLFVAGLKAGKK